MNRKTVPTLSPAVNQPLHPLNGPLYLQVTAGPDRGKLIPLAHDYPVWGRPWLDDPQVSRQQLAWFLDVRGRRPRVAVTNLNPQTPTWFRRRYGIWHSLNKTKRLRAGSYLKCGQSQLRLRNRPRSLSLPVLRKRSKLRWSAVLTMPMMFLSPLFLFRFLPVPAGSWKVALLIGLVIFLVTVGVKYKNHLTPEKVLLLAATGHPPRVSDLPAAEALLGARRTRFRITWAHPGEHLCFIGPRAQATARWWVAQCFLSYRPWLQWQIGEQLVGRGKIRLVFNDNFAGPNSAVSLSTTELPSSPSVGFSQLSTGAAVTTVDTKVVPTPAPIPTITVSWASTWADVPPTASVLVSDKAQYYPTFSWWEQFLSLLVKPVALENTAPTPSSLKSNLPQLLPTLQSTPHKQRIFRSPLRAIYQQWQQPAPGLSVVVGRNDQGPVTIDLEQDGPHALLAGTTGSGKSVALLTWLLGLALRYSPEQLLMVLVDYKGGEAFTQLADLPQVCGVLTDLTPDLTVRALTSLQAEIHYRENYRKTHGCLDLPKLLVVVDEFAILKQDHPDIMQSLIRLAILGRSLGIHLLLATQRPGGIVDSQIKANLPLRICLRVLDAADSNDILGDSRAVQLPAQPGAAWWSSPRQDSPEELQFYWHGGEAFIRQAVQWINATWKMLNLPRPHQPWADPLPKQISNRQLPSPPVNSFNLGLADLPAQQTLRPFHLPWPQQLKIIGDPGSGKTSLLAIFAQAAQADQQIVHFLAATAQPPTSINGTFANQPQLIFETLRRWQNNLLPGTLLIDDLTQITELLDQHYGALTTADLLAPVLQKARAQKENFAITVSPSQGNSKLLAALPTSIVGTVADFASACLLGLDRQQQALLREPGLFIYDPGKAGVLFKAALPTAESNQLSSTEIPNQVKNRTLKSEPFISSLHPSVSHQIFPLSPTSSFLTPPAGDSHRDSSLCCLQPLPEKCLFPTEGIFLSDPASPDTVASDTNHSGSLAEGMDTVPLNLGIGFSGPLALPPEERSWVVVGPGGSGRTNALKILSAQFPKALVLDNVEEQLSELEKWFVSSPRPQLLLGAYPTTIQNGFSPAFQHLHNQAFFLVLGTRTICKPFTHKFDSEALPDHFGLLPGRGMLIDRKKAQAIQVYWAPNLTLNP